MNGLRGGLERRSRRGINVGEWSVSRENHRQIARDRRHSRQAAMRANLGEMLHESRQVQLGGEHRVAEFRFRQQRRIDFAQQTDCVCAVGDFRGFAFDERRRARR